MKNFDVFFGHFLTKESYMPLAGSPPGAALKYAKVIRTDEKGSDVNLATHLLWDGFKGLYKAAVLLTNDSDLLEPVRIVRQELGLTVGILNPHKKASRVGQTGIICEADPTGRFAGVSVPEYSSGCQWYYHEA